MTTGRKYHQDPLIICFVSSCKNTALMEKDKHFFHIPRACRLEWCSVLNKKVPKSAIYICEDHLNLEDDLQNYYTWKFENVRGRLKPRVSDHFKNMVLLHNEQTTESAVPVPSNYENNTKIIMCIPETHEKYVQAQPTTVDCSVSTKRYSKHDKDSLVMPLSGSEYPSVDGSTTEFIGSETSSESELASRQKPKVLFGRNYWLSLIEKKPLSYIGVCKQYYWMIDYLEKYCKIPSLHIIITLYKIKNNETFSRIADISQVSLSTVWRMFYKTLDCLKAFCSNWIYLPDQLQIKTNLPSSFRTNEEISSVHTIIDCFEVEIEKPRSPAHQALTWSQYKHCNTIKYLIGATPDGFINFISKGYGGCTSDMCILEKSGFLDIIPEKCTILADRGFKHLEALLRKSKKNANVLRPPSASKDKKQTRSEVIRTKVVASLRIHIERVIRRVRLFRMLKPHSVVNNKLISSLDGAVVVACGLINLQPPIIKCH